MAEQDVWRALRDELVAGRDCALLAVAAHRGSSPGKAGAIMVVGVDGPLAGTLGGGAVETALVDSAWRRLRAGTLQPALSRHVHRPGEAQASGQRCGGEQQVVMAGIGVGQLPPVQSVLDALATGAQARWELSPAGWRLATADRVPGLAQAAGAWCYTHGAGPTHTAYLVGGGHVSLALSRLLRPLDFRVVVIDERAGLDSLQQNDASHDIWQQPVAALRRIIAPGARSFVAVMTHSHEQDAAALTVLAGLPLGYLGVLGSAAKLRWLASDPALAPLFALPTFQAPMGLPICSRTPAEIAVSIAAAMVAVRNAAH